MSLTRDEWTKMWVSIKKIELEVREEKAFLYDFLEKDIKLIKDKIQQVIGQME